jgi:hypothetical protein
MNRYEMKIRANTRGDKWIDIFPTGINAGIGYLMRIPMREGREMRGRILAENVCAYLNEEADRLHGPMGEA